MLTAVLTAEYDSCNELEALFIMSMCWSLGAGLLEEGRAKFDAYVKYLSSLPTPSEANALAGSGECGLQLASSQAE